MSNQKKILIIFLILMVCRQTVFSQQVQSGEQAPETSIPTSSESTSSTTDVNTVEAEKDPETQRLIEEAKQKIIKERTEKLAAEKKNQEEEAKRKETEKVVSLSKRTRTKTYFGVLGALRLPLNSAHSVGYGYGGSIDTIVNEHYGLHLGFITGMLKTMESTKTAGLYAVSIADGGSIGYTAFDLGFSYVFSRILAIEASLGGGLTIYQLRSPYLSYGTMIAPIIMASAYYSVLPFLQAGIVANISFAGTSSISANGSDYTLDNRQNLTVMSLMLSLRFAFW